MAGRDEAVLWSNDLFDRDTPPRCEGRVSGLTEGLATLWDNHLREGVQDDGRPTLTAFQLEWRGECFSIPDQRAGARQLRQWHLAPGEFADELAAVHAGAGGTRAAAEQLLELAAGAATAGEFMLRAKAALAASGRREITDSPSGTVVAVLRAAATRQQRLQWLGVAAWVALAIMLAAALPAVPAALAQLRQALWGGMALGFLLAAATTVETLVRGMRARLVLAALANREQLAAAQYTVGRVRSREFHRVTLTLADGTRAKFVLSAAGAAAVMREIGSCCPAAVTAGSKLNT